MSPKQTQHSDAPAAFLVEVCPEGQTRALRRVHDERGGPERGMEEGRTGSPLHGPASPPALPSFRGHYSG